MNAAKTLNFFNYLNHVISFDKDRSFRKKVIAKNNEKSNYYNYGQSFFIKACLVLI